MTNDTHHGPLGLLLPQRWMAGAPVHVEGRYSWIFLMYLDNEEVVVWTEEDGVENFPLARVALDLSDPTRLDYGTRLLDQLLDNGGAPIGATTAPGWERGSEWNDRCWALRYGEEVVRFIESDVADDPLGVLCDAFDGGYVHVPGIARVEDSREALVLVLETVQSARGGNC